MTAGTCGCLITELFLSSVCSDKHATCLVLGYKIVREPCYPLDLYIHIRYLGDFLCRVTGFIKFVSLGKTIIRRYPDDGCGVSKSLVWISNRGSGELLTVQWVLPVLERVIVSDTPDMVEVVRCNVNFSHGRNVTIHAAYSVA